MFHDVLLNQARHNTHNKVAGRLVSPASQLTAPTPRIYTPRLVHHHPPDMQLQDTTSHAMC